MRTHAACCAHAPCKGEEEEKIPGPEMIPGPNPPTPVARMPCRTPEDRYPNPIQPKLRRHCQLDPLRIPPAACWAWALPRRCRSPRTVLPPAKALWGSGISCAGALSFGYDQMPSSVAQLTQQKPPADAQSRIVVHASWPEFCKSIPFCAHVPPRPPPIRA